MKWSSNAFMISSILFKDVISNLQTQPARAAVSLSFKVLGDSDVPVDHDAPPILIFHDLLSSKRHWEGLGKTIMNITKRAVVAVDLRNHGDSPHVSSHKYEELADDVFKLMKRLGIAKATFIGHSMGGRTGMCAALMEPKKVAGLVIVDISPISTTTQMTEFFPQILSAMAAINFKGQKNLRKARKHGKRQLRQIISDDNLLSAILSNIIVKKDGNFGWSCNLDVLIKQFKHIASFPKNLLKKQYDGPTIFIGGQLSEFIPADDLTGIKYIFPQAVIKFIPKTRHNVHADDPKTFLELTLAFLRKHKK